MNGDALRVTDRGQAAANPDADVSLDGGVHCVEHFPDFEAARLPPLKEAPMWTQLILPAVCAGGAVFIVSAIIWMLVGWHNKDIQPLPDEDGFVKSLGEHGLKPGLYMWPNCADRSEHGGEAFKAKWKAGPWGTINILGGQPNFLRNLIGTLMINLVVAYAVAVSIGLVLGGVELASGVLVTCSMCQIFVLALLLGAAVYCLGGLGNDLFLGKQGRFIGTSILDGLIFAGVRPLVAVARGGVASNAGPGSEQRNEGRKTPQGPRIGFQ